ncbi:MAG: LacI family DNA-binding transcriptional regulator [Sphingobacterium composti]|uniref:LacI family DNA-binding transcriptional regulator n=1 Tax=Sphingobacterium composti TaxID=363260 RepID=UPI00135C59F0|nr:LacI family DNA-binding transcriptional regulator [Sphingobacterium composti Ten et al. 2007 non Yoo et al. 2007]
MSINDIAKHLKVSKSTVSLVINGKAEQGRISQSLAKRILDYVEEIGYKPNALAKSLATGKSHTIGLIVENIGDSFFGPIALYIEEKLRQYGYHVFYSSTLGNQDNANEILNMMLEKKVEGIILSPTLGQKSPIEKILKKKLPLVLFDRRVEGVEANYVGTDNYVASKNAVQHLFDNGFSRIGFITIESSQPQMLDRLKGYEDVVSDNSVESIIIKLPYQSSIDEFTLKIQSMFKTYPNMDALYFSTNYLCVKTLKILQNINYTNKFGMVAFDDHDLFELYTPTITCVSQPLEELALKAVNSIISQLKENTGEVEEFIIPSKLIIRDSTKK